jgi:RNA polymerase sigma-70 factor, ECF subfamily
MVRFAGRPPCSCTPCTTAAANRRPRRRSTTPHVTPNGGSRLSDPAAAAARLFRAEWGRAVAYLARVLGDVDRAEDAVQEAYLAALRTWPRDGVPERPASWIVATARNRAIDRMRRERALHDREAVLAANLEQEEQAVGVEEEPDVPDERLGLIFACCHPALAVEAQVPMTLRLVAGLEVP